MPEKGSVGAGRKVFTVFLSVVLLVGCVLFALAFWKLNAYNYSTKQTQEIEYVNGTLLMRMTTQVKINNYFPFMTAKFSPVIKKQEQGNWSDVSNSPRGLASNNITLELLKIDVLYGENELHPPSTRINPTNLIHWTVTGMAENIITVNWGYIYSADHYTVPEKRIYYSATDESYPFSSFLEPLSSEVPFPVVVFGLFFVFAGFVFGWILVGDLDDVKHAYSFLTALKINEKTENSLEDASQLKHLKYFPNQLKSLKRFVFSLLFGFSTLFFKSRVSSWYKQHRNDADFYGKKKVDNALKDNSVKSDEKLSGFVPEFASVLGALTFLASVGVSVSWNVGAFVSLVYSFGLFYFFLNIGSTFYLVRKSRKDTILNLLVMVIAFLIILIPEILVMLRRA